MRTNRILRNIGLAFLIVSNLLLIYLFSFSGLKNTVAQSTADFAVLTVSQRSGLYPANDFDRLFASLNLVSDSLLLDTAASEVGQQDQIQKAMTDLKSEKVILLAVSKAAIPALSISVEDSRVAGVILFSPEYASVDSLKTFGVGRPDLPIGVFDTATAYSRSLYEYLSGEDATLFPGFNQGGLISANVYISPDGNRYLSQWNLPTNDISKRLLPFWVQVQSDMGRYINTYLLDGEKTSNDSMFSDIISTHLLKSVGATFLIVGLLLIISSLTKLHNRPETSMDNDTLQPKKKPQRKIFLLTLLAMVAYSVLLLTLSFLQSNYVDTLVAIWPIVYFAIGASLSYKYFATSRMNHKRPRIRIWMGILLGILLLNGTFLLKTMNTLGSGNSFWGWQGGIFVASSVVLFLTNWISIYGRQTNMPQASNFSGLNIPGYKASWTLIFIPYILCVLSGFVLSHPANIGSILYMAFILILGLWLQTFFLRISGTKWLTALFFALFYSLMVFL